ncbi:MAG: GAP family protein [Solirubrobacteraceae bacterium]
MQSDLARVFVSTALATLNPSLLAAVTVMLLLPHPKRLMLGYLLGAYATSITFGLVFAFSLHGSSAVSTSKHTLSPGGDIVAGLIAVAIAYVLATRLDARLRGWPERRQQAKGKAGKDKDKESWQLRLIGRGSARITFGVGVVLSFPGVSYLNALDHIVKLDPGSVPTVLLVVFFCVMQQLLLELPLLGYLLAPEWTQDAVTRFRAWLDRRGRRLGVIAACAIAALLLIRGLITLS